LSRWNPAKSLCGVSKLRTEREQTMTTKTELNEGAIETMHNFTGDQIVKQNKETNQTIKLGNNPKPEADLGDGYNRHRHTGKAACRRPRRSSRLHQNIQGMGLQENWCLRTPKRAGLPQDMDSDRGQPIRTSKREEKVGLQ
jgi:hypothetical protein